MVMHGWCFRAGELLLELIDGVHLHAGGGELILGDWEIYRGADAERFAGVASHGLLNGAVVLHPFKPGDVPDARVVRRRGVAEKIFVTIDVQSEDRVANAGERVETRETFFDSASF